MTCLLFSAKRLDLASKIFPPAFKGCVAVDTGDEDAQEVLVEHMDGPEGEVRPFFVRCWIHVKVHCTDGGKRAHGDVKPLGTIGGTCPGGNPKPLGTNGGTCVAMMPLRCFFSQSFSWRHLLDSCMEACWLCVVGCCDAVQS